MTHLAHDLINFLREQRLDLHPFRTVSRALSIHVSTFDSRLTPVPRHASPTIVLYTHCAPTPYQILTFRTVSRTLSIHVSTFDSRLTPVPRHASPPIVIYTRCAPARTKRAHPVPNRGVSNRFSHTFYSCQHN